MSKILIIEESAIAVIFLDLNTKNIKSYIFNISKLLHTFVSIEKSFKIDCGPLQCHYAKSTVILFSQFSLHQIVLKIINCLTNAAQKKDH